MGEGSLLLRALLEHRDCRPNALINVNHKNFFVVAKKNGAAAARRSESVDMHYDNRLTHAASFVTRLPAEIRIAFKRVIRNQNHPGLPPALSKFDPLEF